MQHMEHTGEISPGVLGMDTDTKPDIAPLHIWDMSKVQSQIQRPTGMDIFITSGQH